MGLRTNPVLQPVIAERTPRENNKLLPQDRSVHDWYRFVLSFPPHLVREYLKKLEVEAKERVLDPFCGTGTTLVECKKWNVPCVGLEANPVAAFATRVKTDWSLDPEGLIRHAETVAEAAKEKFELQGIGEDEGLPLFRTATSNRARLKTLPAESMRLLLRDSVSPLPLHKIIVLLDCIEASPHSEYRDHEKLAMASALVGTASNLTFGPEVGVGAKKKDAPVVSSWLRCVESMKTDLELLRGTSSNECNVYCGDAREPASFLKPHSIDAVITSPPYPNEKDYTRTTRLESVILGFLKSKEDLQALKRSMLRSNTRGVYKGDSDDSHIENHQRIHEIAREIEERRIEMGKTSGFERLYPRVTKLYFGGMYRHFAELRRILRPGAKLAYIVGDQASYLRVMIRTGQILAELAESLGYEVLGIDLFRTRLATATKEQLREEVLLLRWPGPKRNR